MDVCARFKDDLDSKLVEEFNKLQQEGSLEDYLERFEELKSPLLQNRPFMPPEYFLDSFIGGLKAHIKPFVKAFDPATLAETISLARPQEETVQAIKSSEKSFKPTPHNHSFRNNPPLLPTPNPNTRFNPATHNQPKKNAQSNNTLPRTTLLPQRQPKFIPATVRAEKIAKDLSLL